jgi:hypothetical protein
MSAIAPLLGVERKLAKVVHTDDPHRSLAAKFAVMLNTAQTAMMCPVELRQGNETAHQSSRPRTS